MNMSGNTILITGGASGIGLAFAERFLQAGNEVIIAGRRKEKLEEAKEKSPKLHTKACVVSSELERKALFEWVTNQFPETNVLVNNAGIQQRVNLLNIEHDWDYYKKEIEINIDGPIHLSMLFIPHLRKKETAAIINVSSGLALSPGAWVPVYSSTKAAVHSFTASMRHQLADTSIEVIEVFPPAVNTDLGGVGLHTFGAPLDDFADGIFKGLYKGEEEIGYGDSEKRLHASQGELKQGTKLAWEGYLSRNPDFLK
ncbi:SDR family oxidoreductase [Heyndrickxia acidicola]|uniref:SDR family NAD(P)-dependent oxidoreductase n=1 Tax=Heyndrickxia acidicola TaxID=209389 RepID=A0ABU6MIV2_9BACI|nr:SDR family NAD(P)-dependent oxidoreductase [Heyndrickxia acidicola]MED1204596.1 SDR family NAD(P)-dependent oxidoreductase [Heyndrickxia acidicola]